MHDDRWDDDEPLDDDFENFDSTRAERESEAALASEEDVTDGKLLSFYDRLRERIVRAVEKRRDARGGKLTEGAVRALLLVPDVFILLVRLALDKNVPGSTRALIGGALAYFVLPADLFPEMLLGGVGFMDDLVLQRAPEGGMEVRMVKKLRTSAP